MPLGVNECVNIQYECMVYCNGLTSHPGCISTSHEILKTNDYCKQIPRSINSLLLPYTASNNYYIATLPTASQNLQEPSGILHTAPLNSLFLSLSHPLFLLLRRCLHTHRHFFRLSHNGFMQLLYSV